MTLPASARVVTLLGTRDREAAKVFYRDSLGLAVKGEDPFALMLETDGRTIRISELKDFAPRRFTGARVARRRYRRDRNRVEEKGRRVSNL
jgi:catechol 2,3-dioxygenase-like lactoylglutathione lyase family enzyme